MNSCLSSVLIPSSIVTESNLIKDTKFRDLLFAQRICFSVHRELKEKVFGHFGKYLNKIHLDFNKIRREFVMRSKLIQFWQYIKFNFLNIIEFHLIASYDWNLIDCVTNSIQYIFDYFTPEQQ